ncbi:hypothetical protein [Paenibacillus methanolicus]|uniref:Uncharacterized protein n=1 Tax=Paenibacillus methanolicus TaxID=582686 RepID=A0A5S5CD44_9BACL|nr:hypothetical protein [Paenibacillus methanolicus]TYP76432.1 hypothetical protein BCM02_10393 [Paenibacillus methanolicus]
MTISCGVLYDQIAAQALTHYDRILELEAGYLRVGCAGNTDVLQDGLLHLRRFLRDESYTTASQG